MFNILGFHTSSSSSSCLREEEILKKYSRDRTEEEQVKEELFYENTENDLMTDLTDRDVRVIMKSEEELSQTQHFERLFPDPHHKRFYIHTLDQTTNVQHIPSLLDCLDVLTYSDQLMMQWEQLKNNQTTTQLLREKILSTVRW